MADKGAGARTCARPYLHLMILLCPSRRSWWADLDLREMRQCAQGCSMAPCDKECEEESGEESEEKPRSKVSPDVVAD